MKKNYYPIAAFAAALSLAGLGCLAQSNPADGAAPVLVPAVKVAHAGSAAVLAATTAGQRWVTVGDHGVVMLSDDQGKQWRQAQSVAAEVALTGVSFADAKQGWASGQRGVILYTQDGGEHWTAQRSSLEEDRPLFAIHMFDSRTGVAVGLWSLVLKTTDGGASWRTITITPPNDAKKADLNLYGLFASPDGTLWATSERGTLLRSKDQGEHWDYVYTGYKGTFWTGAVTSDGVVFVGGLRGSLYRSTDSGAHWDKVDLAVTASVTALVPKGREISGVGLDGLRFDSTDGGRTVHAHTDKDRKGYTALITGSAASPTLFSREGVGEMAAAP